MSSTTVTTPTTKHQVSPSVCRLSVVLQPLRQSQTPLPTICCRTCGATGCTKNSQPKSWSRSLHPLPTPLCQPPKTVDHYPVLIVHVHRPSLRVSAWHFYSLRVTASLSVSVAFVPVFTCIVACHLQPAGAN